jgi:hypothetical protein
MKLYSFESLRCAALAKSSLERFAPEEALVEEDLFLLLPIYNYINGAKKSCHSPHEIKH